MQKEEIVTQLQNIAIRLQNAIGVLRKGQEWVAGDKFLGVYTMIDRLGAALQEDIEKDKNAKTPENL